MRNHDIGKFCNQCSKSVIDFSKMNDFEIIELIEKKSLTLCGRFSKEQLNRDIEIERSKNNPHLIKLFAGLILFVTSPNLLGTSRNINILESTKSLNSKKLSKQEFRLNESNLDSPQNIIKGIIIDNITMQPVSTAQVIIKGTNIGTNEIHGGRFELLIPDYFSQDKFQLEIVALGYETAEFAINKVDLPLTKDFFVSQACLEEISVVVGGITVKRKKWWQFWKKF